METSQVLRVLPWRVAPNCRVAVDMLSIMQSKGGQFGECVRDYGQQCWIIIQQTVQSQNLYRRATQGVKNILDILSIDRLRRRQFKMRQIKRFIAICPASTWYPPYEGTQLVQDYGWANEASYAAEGISQKMCLHFWRWKAQAIFYIRAGTDSVKIWEAVNYLP